MVIRFSHDGRDFTADQRAYDVGRIVLPEGRVLDVQYWQESLPPIPQGLQEVNHTFTGTPEEIAKIMNGVLATEVTD